MNQKAVALLILFAILSFVFAGCARSRRQPEGDVTLDAKAQAEGSSDAAAPAVPMRLTDEGEARSVADDSPGSESPAPAVPRSRPADPRDTAFAEVRFRFATVYPYDAVIGRLQHTRVGTISDRSAYQSARSFLAALVDGELPEDMLSEELGRGAQAVLDELLWRSADLADVRIGGVHQLSEVDVSLRFRMLGANQEAVGELVLANEDGRWYTADIQVEYRDRRVEPRFDPAATSRRATR